MGKLYSPRPTFAKMLQNCVLLQQSGPCATIKASMAVTTTPITQHLRHHGYSITAPRLAVLRVLQQADGPLKRAHIAERATAAPPAGSSQPAAPGCHRASVYRALRVLALPPCICAAGHRISAWQSPSSHTTTILPVRCVARARMWPHQSSRPPCKPPPGATAIALASIASRSAVCARAASIVPAPIRMHMGTHTAPEEATPASATVPAAGGPAGAFRTCSSKWPSQ